MGTVPGTVPGTFAAVRESLTLSANTTLARHPPWAGQQSGSPKPDQALPRGATSPRGFFYPLSAPAAAARPR